MGHSTGAVENHLERTLLCELALRYGSDKCGPQPNFPTLYHSYTPFYFEVFKDRREEIKQVLEIGIWTGASLRMWRDFFPHAEVFGLDIDPQWLIHEERIHCFQANQRDERSMRQALANIFNITGGISFDLIVDDASHEAEDQIASATLLYNFLSPRGVYVIEDVRQGNEDRVHQALQWAAKIATIEFRIDAQPDDRLIVMER